MDNSIYKSDELHLIDLTYRDLDTIVDLLENHGYHDAQLIVECEELAQYLRDSMDRIKIKWQQLKEL